MKEAGIQTDGAWEEVYARQFDTVYRLCFLYLKNAPDAEDAVQAVFLKLMEAGPAFENERHEKAWLIVTASNYCKNMLRHWWRRSVALSEQTAGAASPETSMDETLELVLRLPSKYRAALYLHYYEGYTSAEIGHILHQKDSTVRTYLSKGRNMLKLEIGGE